MKLKLIFIVNANCSSEKYENSYLSNYLRFKVTVFIHYYPFISRSLEMFSLTVFTLILENKMLKSKLLFYRNLKIVFANDIPLVLSQCCSTKFECLRPAIAMNVI